CGVVTVAPPERNWPPATKVLPSRLRMSAIRLTHAYNTARRCEGENVAHIAQHRPGVADRGRNQLGAGRSRFAGLWRRQGFERRRAAWGGGHDHEDGHGPRANRLYSGGRRLRP